MYRKMYAGGRFYPSDKVSAESFIVDNLDKIDITKENIKGIIVPHAGWDFSGKNVLKTINSIENIKQVETFIIFGAVHTVYVDEPVLFDSGSWETPFGDIKIDEDMINNYSLRDYTNVDPKKHFDEHSIEVQIPFIKYLNRNIKIIPISIPPIDIEKYEDLINIMKKICKNENVLFMTSTDLTHYGRRFGYAPKGTGEKALNWVKEEKDKKFIDLIKNKKYKNIVQYSKKNNSACGAGGVALITSVLEDYSVKLIDYTTSADEYPAAGTSSFVTYAGLAFINK